MRAPLLMAVLPMMACSPEAAVPLSLQGPAITELSHVVTTRAQASTVALTVTRQLISESDEWAEVEHTIVVPTGAVVTGLKVGAQGAALLDAEAASSRWEELISLGRAEPTTSAKLTWLPITGQLELSLFGLPPHAAVTLSYELEVPPVAEDGLWAFDYPTEDAEPSWALAPPAFELSATAGVVEETDGLLHVSLPRAPINRIDAKWALFPFGGGRTMWRLELDAAPVLERAPVRPNVVFVVDASHSQGPAGIAAQLEVIAPYLLQVPDAQVEVVVYRRFAERLFGRFVAATDFAATLHAVPAERLAPGNGSNLELGAALAAQVLEGSASPGRVVLFTDEELREGFTNDAALEALKRAPTDTVVHVVSRSGFSDGELSERRNDDDPLSPIAKASGGVFFELSGHPVDLLQGTRAMTPLVRPTRIDALEIDSALLTIDHPSEFDEGATLRATAIDAEPPREIKVRGFIWGRAFERVVRSDATLTRALPALAIGLDDIESQLSDDEVRVAAQAAGAVSRVTSLLAARENAGASTIGRTLTLGVGQSMWSCGCGGSFGTTSSCGGFFRGGPQPDYDEALRGLLGAGLAACGASSGHLHLEATGDEIVDVELTGLSPTADTCVTELVWNARLTPIFAHHRSYELDLQRVVTDH